MPHINQWHWIIFQQSNFRLLCPSCFFLEVSPASNLRTPTYPFFWGEILGCRGLFFSMATGMGVSHWKDVSVFIYNYNHEKERSPGCLGYLLGMILHSFPWELFHTPEKGQAENKHWKHLKNTGVVGFGLAHAIFAPRENQLFCCPLKKLGTDNSPWRTILIRCLTGPPKRSFHCSGVQCSAWAEVWCALRFQQQLWLLSMESDKAWHHQNAPDRPLVMPLLPSDHERSPQTSTRITYSSYLQLTTH